MAEFYVYCQSPTSQIFAHFRNHKSSTYAKVPSKTSRDLVGLESAKSHRKRNHQPGWKSTLSVGRVAIAFVFAVNFTLFVWALLWKSPDAPITSGFNTIFFRFCQKANWITIISHLLINGLSTILLVTRKAAMQVLSAHQHVQKLMQLTGLDAGLILTCSVSAI